MNEMRTNRVVIIGGGVAGSELACGLSRAARSIDGSGEQIDVTLVDSSSSHLWKPFLYKVATGSAYASDIEAPFGLMANSAGFRYVAGRLSGLDRDRRRVVVSTSDPAAGRSALSEVEYDTLVIAVGSRVDTYRTPGVVDNCVMIQSTAQAEAFKQLLLARLQLARRDAPPLSIAIVGGGVASIEMAVEISRVARSRSVSAGISYAKHLPIVLIEESSTLSELVSEKVAAVALKRLLALGIAVVSDCRVRRVLAGSVELSDGRSVDAGITVWAAGTKAPDELAELDGLEVNRSNQLMVLPTMQTTRDERIYAIGDCGCLADAAGGPGFSATAWSARDQARHLLKQLPMLFRHGVPVAAYSPGLLSSRSSTAVADAYGSLFRSNLLSSGSLRGRSGQMRGGLMRLSHMLALQGRWRGASLGRFGLGM